MCQPQYSTSP